MSAGAIIEDPSQDKNGELDPSQLRRWLRHYGRSHSNESAMIRVWRYATDHESELQGESATGLEWGAFRMARFLEPLVRRR